MRAHQGRFEEAHAALVEADRLIRSMELGSDSRVGVDLNDGWELVERMANEAAGGPREDP